MARQRLGFTPQRAEARRHRGLAIPAEDDSRANDDVCHHVYLVSQSPDFERGEMATGLWASIVVADRTAGTNPTHIEAPLENDIEICHRILEDIGFEDMGAQQNQIEEPP